MTLIDYRIIEREGDSMPADSKPEFNQANSILSKPWVWNLAIVLVLGLGGGWIVISRLSDSAGPANDLAPAPVAGHPAPDFSLKTLEGEAVSLADFKGKPVLINFWATWCGPCRVEMPELQQAAVDNAEGLVVIGINNTSTDTRQLVDDFVQELGLTFPIVLDEDGQVAETYRVLGLPTTIFVDRNGVVNEIFTGPINKAYIESKIPEL
jgi:peroxiredoxin